MRDWHDWAEAHLRDIGWAEQGDWVVLPAGKPLGESKRTNTMALHRIGDERAGYAGH